MSKIFTYEDIKKTVLTSLKNYTSFPESSITEKTGIREIGLDSLDMLELGMDIELIYNIDISDEEIEKINYIKDLINLTFRKIKEK